jgi:hypothetical protein
MAKKVEGIRPMTTPGPGDYNLEGSLYHHHDYELL